MNSSDVKISTILDRILEKAADNLRIAKILVQLGLDPDRITFDAIFNRLLEIFLANITIANICALVGATFLVPQGYRVKEPSFTRCTLAFTCSLSSPHGELLGEVSVRRGRKRSALLVHSLDRRL